MASSSVEGKSVIVTGGGGGLGYAIASAYLAEGASVTICDVNKKRLATCEGEWNQLHYGRFLVQQTDVSDESAVQKLVDAAVAKFGRLDILINNAAIMDVFSPVGACSKEMWDRVLGINLNGPYHATKAAIAQFEKQSPVHGVIISIGSNASKGGFHSGAAYTVSKAGVMALTKNTAGFYGPKGIYSMALLLGGMVGTNIADAFQRGLNMEMYSRVQGAHTAFDEKMHAVPLESIAKYCIFLTSDKEIASSANGSCIDFNKNWPEA